MAKAMKVADLGDQPERRTGRDALKAREDLDTRRPGLLDRDLLQVAIERIELAIEPVEMHEHLAQRGVGEVVIQTLTGDPGPMHLRPLRRAVPVDPAVAQQLLCDPMTGGGARAAQIVIGRASDL
jgi:hypothetical protein